MSDNASPIAGQRSIRIVNRFRFQFDLAMQVAFQKDYNNGKPAMCVGYKKQDGGMMLFGYEPDKKTDFFPLPYPMNFSQASEFVWGFIENTAPSYNKPDTDGSVEKGFEITTEGTDWMGEHGSFLFVRPIWLVYGK